MNKLTTMSAALLLTLSAAVAGAETSTWKIDSAHSEIDFTIRHMAVSNVHGRFGNIAGTVTYDDKAPTKSSVDAKIDVTTVDTGVAARDTHLKSSDFFDTDKFPQASFVSKKITKKGTQLLVTGDLTLKGVTKSVTLDTDGPSKPVTDAKGGVHSGFSASTTINRQDFGLTWGGTTPGGDAMLGDEIKLTLELEIVKQ